MTSGKISVLMEVRPAFDGYAGIPQETRLLFRGLLSLESFETSGMMQHPTRTLASGTHPTRLRFFRLSESRAINRYSRFVISLAEKPFYTVLDRVSEYFERRLQGLNLLIQTALRTKKIKFSDFRSLHFTDFVWRTLFAKTLPASDFGLVTSADYRICSVPWKTMHQVGLYSLNFVPTPIFPRLDTRGVDVFIGQTPYPGKVTGDTAFVIRYHDAIPVFMPHTIHSKSVHQASHVYALMANVRAGAWFACVSEATRRDLLKLFPDAAARTVTIHNMVSHHYYREESSASLVPGIIRSRLHDDDPVQPQSLVPDFFSLREKEGFYRRCLGGGTPLKYLLMVSTIEPRKNHARLLAAWEIIKADIDRDMKLVVVGALGWDTKGIVAGFKEWIDRGEVFMLEAVPAPDLRVLYKHAAVTVCPSLGEGFDYSGVESMASGGVVVASDIEVHGEVYEDAAVYFDRYSTASLVDALKKVVYNSDAGKTRARLVERGAEVAARYRPETILPLWDAFLKRVVAQNRGASERAHGGAARGPCLAIGKATLAGLVSARDTRTSWST